MKDLTKGSIVKGIITFSIPLIIANILQQMYNVTDTIIIGKVLGKVALSAVGSAFTLMTFLTSIIIGLCMGVGTVISNLYGKKETNKIKNTLFMSFVFIFLITIVIMLIVYLFHSYIIRALNIPSEVAPLMSSYLLIIYIGIIPTFIYNFFASFIRSLTDSLSSLIVLFISTILNIGLDLFFVLNLKMGINGAAIATVISQTISALIITIYALSKYKDYLPNKDNFKIDKPLLSYILKLSTLTSFQQSIMNLGILTVQGIVNSFGTNVMAAFTAAVKIDSFAYLIVQDFANGFSTFVAQNNGAKDEKRIHKGTIISCILSGIFSIFITLIILFFKEDLLKIFIDGTDREVINIGINYLNIEGSFYIGIGILFLLYAYFRGINKPLISIILTIISLGLRIVLSIILSKNSALKENGIWLSIPIGWFIADIFGFILMIIVKKRKKMFMLDK